MSDPAAWVQAIGSILAIIVAIWVPSRIHSNETRKKDNETLYKGQAIALLVRPLLLVVDGQLERNSFVRQEGVSKVELPLELTSYSMEYWQMGEAGGHILQLIATLQTHNRLVDDTFTIPMDMDEDERREFSRLYRERIALARECIANASSAIEALLAENPAGRE